MVPVSSIPEATRILISVKKIASISGLSLSFAAGICTLHDGTIIDRYNQDTFSQFTFVLVFDPVEHSFTVSASSATMHARLGHQPPAVMQALGYSAEATLCAHCCAGNITRTFSRTVTTSHTAPLQLLRVHICGPISVR